MALAKNKKAFHEYFIEDKLEAGIELIGSEVKSIKASQVSIKEAFIRIINGEIFIMGMSVVPWNFGSVYNPEERRVRKLLIHKKEIAKLHEKVSQKGYAIVPISVYQKAGRIKIEIALGKGKTNYDKRDTLAKKDAKRQIDRALKDTYR
ncbi:SsrA-binding protein SmpB [Psychrilyobacter sp.]|uniref:SsrA-binding protein SmpB n=1 Tax=Psychrilyobacter sp. TaxID=2586924 RepID=UPI0030198E40